MCGYPANNFPVLFREEKLRLTMFEPWVLARCNRRHHIAFQRRNPVGIIGIKPERQVNKGAFVCLGCNRPNDDVCHSEFPKRIFMCPTQPYSSVRISTVSPISKNSKNGPHAAIQGG